MIKEFFLKASAACILLAGFLMSGCDKSLTISDISFERTSIEIPKGGKDTLHLTVTPAEAVAEGVVWSSSDSDVATVDEGIITAVGIGEAVIKAEVSGKVAECTVTVVPVSVTSVNLDKENVEMKVSEQITLTATVLPENAEDKTVEWSTSDESVVTVDDQGTLTAIAIGNAIVTATAGQHAATCIVNVVATEVESIVLDKTEIEMTVGGTETLVATVSPQDATNPSVTWKSGDESIATVVDGTVTAVAVGETEISATAGDKTAVCKVAVLPIEVEQIILSEESIRIQVGNTVSISAEVLPEDATDKSLSWTSSDEAVVSIVEANDNGVTVEALSQGEAVIRATSGDVIGECSIEVYLTPAIGDFYYSDGTWSSELDESKTVIGVVFWAGDPSKDDAALKREHPECVNGLVVSIDGDIKTQWQTTVWNYNAMVGDWISENVTDYENITAEDVYNLDDNLNKIMGYNNTKAIEEFNKYNPDYIVEAVDEVVGYRSEVPAPANTSDWYLPSAKELVLMYHGEYEGTIYSAYMSDDNRRILEEKFAMIPGAVDFSTVPYWSSTERALSFAFALYFYDTTQGMLTNLSKANTLARVRCILAF